MSQGMFMDMSKLRLNLAEQDAQFKGEQQGKKQIALNMLKAKMDVDMISQLTGLSVSEIVELKKLL